MNLNIDKNYWDNRYENEDTGWDIGYVSPPIKAYIDQLDNKELKILIPGAGNSYEAEYIHNNGFTNLTVIDISEQPLANLAHRISTFPNSKLIHGDFFELEGEFDVILEQTFFCALDPKLRPNYVTKMHELLAPGGNIAGLLFNVPLNTDHPAFGGNTEEYKELFSPLFELKTLAPCYNSIEKRMGREVFINFIKK